MDTWIIVAITIAAFVIGYALATYLIAKDKDLFRLAEDEIIVKKPVDGLVLVAVPPHVMRRLITHPEGFDSTEARSMIARGGK
jgi:hypothetical protein